ncbi:sperm surface protein Sp17 [Leptidea sinapis]|uniref:sperm surface protein Sp17 n=1 Tax=Leptidea sinapis TaxID=189913 RepID=UPI00213390B7|nr:sperm surface protein Sp17 [Leptidea sinapis]
MGCNTSSEAKKEEKDSQENQENAAAEEKQKESTEASNTTEEQQAATKIQAVFRGHKTRKSVNMKAADKAEKPDSQEPTKAELEAEFRADDKDLCNAATKIQASFRGHQARKQTQVVEKTKEEQDKEDVENIDLTDPDLNKAATKIQASFRGHKVRKDTTN